MILVKRLLKVKCFSLDTIIMLEGESEIKISEVKIGDKVTCDVYNSGKRITTGINTLQFLHV